MKKTIKPDVLCGKLPRVLYIYYYIKCFVKYM